MNNISGISTKKVSLSPKIVQNSLSMLQTEASFDFKSKLILPQHIQVLSREHHSSVTSHSDNQVVMQPPRIMQQSPTIV